MNIYVYVLCPPLYKYMHVMNMYIYIYMHVSFMIYCTRYIYIVCIYKYIYIYIYIHVDTYIYIERERDIDMIHIIWITDIIYYINCLAFDKRIQGVITDLHIMYCRSKFELSHTECWNICCVPFAARCSVRLPADFNSTLRKGKCFHTICIHSFSVCSACIAASHAMPWRFSRP